MMHPRNPALRYLLLLTIVNLAVGQRVKLVALVSNLVQPVAVLEDPIPGGKRKFVVEKGGTVRIASGATGTILGTFLNFRSIVTQDVPEGGMLGMAFHPDYARNGYFFVNYTQRNNGKLVTIIRRLRVSRTNRNRAVVGNPVNEILMRIDQPFPNHNGGQLVFSPGDKMLYIGTGDGGGAGDPQNNSQNKKTLLGKILRINPTVNSAKAGYTIPDDNPYAQSSDGSRREIWHYGLRNPWRFTFDRATADMWIGDVGQVKFEEIDFASGSERNLNFGWNIKEGTLAHFYSSLNRDTEKVTATSPVLRTTATGNSCYSSTPCAVPGLARDPVLSYGRDEGRSVTGGYRYRGRRISWLQGSYVFADFATGTIWRATWDAASSRWTKSVLLNTGRPISSFGENRWGELLVVDYGGTVSYLRSA